MTQEFITTGDICPMGKKRKDRDREREDRDRERGDVSVSEDSIGASPPFPLPPPMLTSNPPPSKKRKFSRDESLTVDVPEGSKQTVNKTVVQPTSEEVGRMERVDEVKEEREKYQLLLSALSNTQEDQYEIFRRSTFPKSTIRRIMQGMCGGTVPQNVIIAMAGITKVYVGEIVEEACHAREAMGEREEGPLQPKHIREAVRRLRKVNKVPNSKYKRIFPLE